MKKFNDIYKKKVEESENLQETKILKDFRVIYNALLEHYGLTSIHELNDNSQLSFLTELNNYWSEEEGLSEKGVKFLDKRSMTLNENSTTVQKKNFLRTKANIIINETLRKTNLKYKIYDILDEIYKETGAKDINGILPIQTIATILHESVDNVLNNILEEINNELTESAKEVSPKKKYYVKIKAK